MTVLFLSWSETERWGMYSKIFNRAKVKQSLSVNNLLDRRTRYTKTHAMVVGSRPKLKRISEEVSEQPSFFINGTQIETVERTKYLGVQLDCHLVWDEQVKGMRNKVSRALGFLKYAKKFLQ